MNENNNQKIIYRNSSYTSFIIWTIGFMFTIGLDVIGDLSDLAWYGQIAVLFIAYVAWPYILGHWIVSK